MNKLSGRQKKKFRRIINMSIKSDIELPSMQLPTEFAKQLNKQVRKANIFKNPQKIDTL